MRLLEHTSDISLRGRIRGMVLKGIIENAFGSAVSSDQFRENSDIDFLISFDDSISPEEYSENYFQLQYSLRELFNREIDIITERSLSNPYFIESVNKNKVLIYEA